MNSKKLSDTFSVAGQIHPKNVADVAKSGFTTLVNFRPDGEAWTQPKAAAVEAAATEAGLNYVFIPVSMRDGISQQQIDQLKKAAADDADGKILAFCRSGTRAAFVWAFSQKGILSADEIITAGDIAGYDLAKIRPFLE